jgi:hypothetical protein
MMIFSNLVGVVGVVGVAAAAVVAVVTVIAISVTTVVMILEFPQNLPNLNLTALKDVHTSSQLNHHAKLPRNSLPT